MIQVVSFQIISMNNLDTVKIHFNKNLVCYNPLNFGKRTNEIEDVELTSFHLKPKKKKTGIKDIIINDTECIIDLSSKLIPDLYSEMINKNTIKPYLNEILKLDLIEFDTNSIIENAELYSCDVTNNIKPICKPVTYINALSIYKFNYKYDCKYHINESIIFDRDVTTKSLKERLQVYNKYVELHLKRNASFRDKINVEYYKDKLRCESRFLNQEKMRTSFNTTDIKLLSILNSDAKINYNLLNRITDIPSIDIESFNNFQQLIEMKNKIKHSKIRNIEGDLSIVKSCKCDIDLIRLYFKTNSTANNSKYIYHYKQLIQAVKEIESKNTIAEKVNEMKELLNAS